MKGFLFLLYNSCFSELALFKYLICHLKDNQHKYFLIRNYSILPKHQKVI